MSEMPPVRLIATDVDGTLLASDGKLPEDNRRAILAAPYVSYTRSRLWLFSAYCARFSS